MICWAKSVAKSTSWHIVLSSIVSPWSLTCFNSTCTKSMPAMWFGCSACGTADWRCEVEPCAHRRCRIWTSWFLVCFFWNLTTIGKSEHLLNGRMSCVDMQLSQHGLNPLLRHWWFRLIGKYGTGFGTGSVRHGTLLYVLVVQAGKNIFRLWRHSVWCGHHFSNHSAHLAWIGFSIGSLGFTFELPSKWACSWRRSHRHWESRVAISSQEVTMRVGLRMGFLVLRHRKPRLHWPMRTS